MKIYMSIVFLILNLGLCGQSDIKGMIHSAATGEVLEGATVQWINQNEFTLSDAEGIFTFSGSNPGQEQKIAVSFIGFQTDTFIWEGEMMHLMLTEDREMLNEVVVQESDLASRRSSTTVENLEVINQSELKKAACCDLSGCFETQSSVQPNVINAISNGKELRLLGLAGYYNQILINGMVNMVGLPYPYGLASHPGTLVKQISVAKGANSVLQGFDGLSGQINMLTLEPKQTEPLFLNLYGNSFGETQFNIHSGIQVSKEKEINTLLAFHTAQAGRRTDRDKDNFLDLPLTERYMLMNNWSFRCSDDLGWSAELGFRYVNESRVGGELQYQPRTHRLTPVYYGQDIAFQQFDFMAKQKYNWNSKHKTRFDVSGYLHDQNSVYGITDYQADQVFVQSKLLHAIDFKQERITVGLAYRHQELEEDIRLVNDLLNRTYAGEYHTGLQNFGFLAEYEQFLWKKKIRLLGGLRWDTNPQLGNFLTARFQFKYQIHPQHVFRMNVGNGWRQINLFSEHVHLLAGSRNVEFLNAPQAEEGVNFGASYTYSFGGEWGSGYLSLDAYRTEFSRQIFPEFRLKERTATLDYNGHTAFSNSFQVEGRIIYKDWLEFKLGYNYLEVIRETSNGSQLIPFTPKHRINGSVNLSYNDWMLDLNAKYLSKMRLPFLTDNPEIEVPEYSDPFTIISTQLTRKFDAFEIYAGVENIFDFRQIDPYISNEQPFGPYFDPGFVWGPTRGREIYLGVRYTVE